MLSKSFQSWVKLKIQLLFFQKKTISLSPCIRINSFLIHSLPVNRTKKSIHTNSKCHTPTHACMRCIEQTTIDWVRVLKTFIRCSSNTQKHRTKTKEEKKRSKKEKKKRKPTIRFNRVNDKINEKKNLTNNTPNQTKVSFDLCFSFGLLYFFFSILCQSSNRDVCNSEFNYLCMKWREKNLIPKIGQNLSNCA